MSKVTIYVRNRQTREYELADPKKKYPDDTIWCLRYKQDGKRKWETLISNTQVPGLGMSYHLARSIAKIREGYLELQQPATPSAPGKELPAARVKIADAVEAYIADLYRENNLTKKTIQGKHFELKRWAEVGKKTYMDELSRADMLGFRDWLRREEFAEWTVASNMMSVVICLKHNPLTKVVDLLKPADWPVIEDSQPEPYTLEEVKAFQSVADPFYRLVIRFFVGTGCREQEVAHVEWADINWVEKTVWIHAKPKWNWKPKTKAGTRVIPLSDALVRDLKTLKAKAKGSLIFPAARGGVEFHFLRIFQELGEEAGVTGVKCHRFRDTYITDKIQEGVDLNTIRVWVGHENFDTLKLYAQALRNKDHRARTAANAQDRYTFATEAAD